jgi:predicted alpha/beta-fold hydrolase
VNHKTPDLTEYRPPWWLPGGHLQTLYGALFAPVPEVEYQRSCWETPDGDIVAADSISGPASAPLVVLFHGLEGGSRSQYARSLMAEIQRMNWRGLVPHFRGCGGMPNRLPRAYHSGDTVEIEWMLQRAREMAGAAPLFAVGVSMGGNALLKWCGERGTDASGIVTAIVAISVPYELAVTGDHLARGINLIYTWNFLRTLKASSRRRLLHFPKLFDGKAMERARNMREFDDAVTAPMHGFKNVDDYWAQASCKGALSGIRVPTLLIHARNDPFMPAASLPTVNDVSDQVSLDFCAAGGHVGYAAAPMPGKLAWLPQRIMRFLEQHVQPNHE